MAALTAAKFARPDREVFLCSLPTKVKSWENTFSEGVDDNDQYFTK
jgi:hypothetical protein